MGFMLLECGLGLYELALLHLLAHSLYKAHAFLTAGEAVMDTRRRQLFPDSAAAAPMRLAGRLAAAPLAMAAVWLCAQNRTVPQLQCVPLIRPRNASAV